MNQELLIKLEKQAEKLTLDIPAPLDDADFTCLFNEQFAKLIVAECARSLWTEECHTSDLAVEEFNRNSKKIKQHFGVEE